LYLPADGDSAKLFFNEKITSNNTGYGGIHPLVSLQSHHANLAGLIGRALQALPDAKEISSKTISTEYGIKHKPDFVTVTRGPGMRSNLSCGIDTAKGLSVAWQVPLMAVHHMQAHALTPRLVNALEPGSGLDDPTPQFPFLNLLVSGGHTLLVHSKSLTNHEIIASTQDIAIGDALDKIGRILLPKELLNNATDTAFAKHLSNYAFETKEDFKHWKIARSRAEEILRDDNQYGWKVNTPFADTRDLAFSFSGLASRFEGLFDVAQKKGISSDERLLLARTAMGTAIEHLGSRTIIALKKLKSEGSMPGTLVVSGGVASNDFLRYALRKMLNVRGFSDVQLTFPPVHLCTDNAAMIAWTGIEMYEAGYRSGLDTLAQRKWSLEKLLQPEIESII
jgi:N6-L-threonylcarbamoyladenine synthase